jgi:hypothetical protein
MLLSTTLIDENAMAAPAINGLSRPDIATGIAIVL